MVERRRKPLILCSTKHLINSTVPTNNLFPHESLPTFRLPVGILRFSNPANPSLDHSALLALSTSLLKTLSITSGSPVIQTPSAQFPIFFNFLHLNYHSFLIFIRFWSRMLIRIHRKLQWLLLLIHQAPPLT